MIIFSDLFGKDVDFSVHDEYHNENVLVGIDMMRPFWKVSFQISRSLLVYDFFYFDTVKKFTRYDCIHG